MTHSRHISDDVLDAQVRALDPSQSFHLDESRLETAISTARIGPKRVRGNHRRPLVWASVVVATLIGGSLAAPALADGIGQLTHTGRFGATPADDGRGGAVSLDDDSEWLTSEGEDYSQVIASYYPTWMPLPAGVSVEEFKADAVSRYSELGGESQSALFESSFEFDGRCMWVAEWLSAHDASDVPRAAEAASVIRESITWPATTAVAGGGVVEHLTSLADAADSANPAPLEYLLSVDCSAVPVGLIQ